MEKAKKLAPGVLLCLAIAVPCWFLGKAFPIIGGPVFAILAGMVITRKKERRKPGSLTHRKKFFSMP